MYSFPFITEELLKEALNTITLLTVYTPDCKQQLKTMKKYPQIQDIVHFKSGMYCYY